MKRLIVFFAVAGAFLLCCERNWADSDTSTSPTPGQGRRGGSKRIQTDLNDGKGKGSSKTIRGHCTLLAGGGNPFSGSCVDTVLILNDAKGAEQLRVRTSSAGVFEFASLDPRGVFAIVSGSRFYEVVSPTVPLHSGDQVELKLRQK